MPGKLKINAAAMVAVIAAVFLFAGNGGSHAERAAEIKGETVPAVQLGAVVAVPETEMPAPGAELSAQEQEASAKEERPLDALMLSPGKGEAETELLAAAPRAGLYNARTLSCIYAKNQNERMCPASLTKIVTACTALQYVDTEEVIRVGTELRFVNEGSSVCWLQKGQKLTMYDLLAGMLLCSGNDAAYTVAVNAGRNAAGNAEMSDQEALEYFYGLMNAFVERIGADNSHFVNPDGWDDDAQYTSVWDMAMITSYAMKIPEIREIAGQYSREVHFVSGQTVTWKSTNSLMNPESKYYHPQVIGLKTGSTSRAGKCLISVIQMDGEEYISIVSGCEKDKERFTTSLELIQLLTDELSA